MFVHQHQLEYQLRPEQYHSLQQHELELDRLFLPNWHLVARRDELATHGDFVTRDLLGQPLILQNFDGELCAFLNVCAHRHCVMVSQERGRRPTIRCQYHGWEYGKTGHTCRIPDARCFRPFDRENAQLTRFRLECCGDLVFVSLADDGPDLRDYLGARFDYLVERFSSPWRYQWTWHNEYACNWKAPVENTLESYHVPALHPKSLRGIYPGEEFQTHVLDERFTTLEYDLREDAKTNKLIADSLRRLGGKPENLYVHHHVHPNHVFIVMDLHAFAYVYQPVSRTSATVRIYAYGYRGTRRGPVAWLTYKIAAFFGRRTTIPVLLEDVAIMQAQQRGLEMSRSRGCIGTREERVYAFQRYVKQACDGQSERSISEIARSRPR